LPTADYSSYHQPSGTGADGTKLDNFIDAVQATVNGLDKNNLAASAGILASQIADPTTGKVLGSSGSACAAVFPPGFEYNYTEITSAVGAIAGTTQGTSATIITASSAVTFDGAHKVRIEFMSPSVANTNAGASISLWLFEDGVGLGLLGRVTAAAANAEAPAYGWREFFPSVGTHTYSVRASVSAGTGTVNAGNGSIGAYNPTALSIKQS
jgi:hypothetical protein